MSESQKLSEEKLYECFKSLNVPVRLSDLKNPTKEFVIYVFQAFLKDLQFANLFPFEAIRHCENQEYCEEGQMLFILSCTMTEIMKEYSNLTITLNDIVNPKPKRTKRIFNYLIIFWSYYLKKFDLFESVEKHLQPEQQKIADLKMQNEALEENYLECIAKLRDMHPSKEEIHKSYVVKNEQVKNLEQVRKEVLEKYQELKEEENQLRTQISGADIAVVNAKEKLSELDQLIVSSPEKKKSDIQNLKDLIKEVEQQISEKELERKEKKTSYNSLVLTQEDFAKNDTRQLKIRSEVQILNETVEKTCMLFTKHEEEKQNLNELMSTLEMKEAMTNVYGQKCAKVQLSKKNQIEEISETLINLQRLKEEEKNKSEKIKLHIKEAEEIHAKKADSIFDVIKQCEIAAAETEKVRAIYDSEMQVINESYRNNCEQIIAAAKRFHK